jgi:hypothetical protein
MNIEIVTYNILCGKLGEEHVQSFPDNQSNIRYSRIEGVLSDSIEKKSIICLQEVGQQWAGNLFSFFQRRSYSFLYAPYGNFNNDFMGVAIAIPNALFEVTNAKLFKPTSLKGWPSQRNSLIDSYILKPLFMLSKYFGIFDDKDEWKIAKYKLNTCITIRLKERASGKEFVVGTYHMPCNFSDPQVMIIHSCLALRGIQEYAETRPYILAGDFNFKPSDVMYQLYTQGFIPLDHPNYPICSYDSWTPAVLEPVISAYKEFNGKEPDFTNCGSSGEKPVFIGVLDYIFCSKTFKVENVGLLPSISDLTTGRLPSQKFPSDHLLLSASLRIF